MPSPRLRYVNHRRPLSSDPAKRSKPLPNAFAAQPRSWPSLVRSGDALGRRSVLSAKEESLLQACDRFALSYMTKRQGFWYDWLYTTCTTTGTRYRARSVVSTIPVGTATGTPFAGRSVFPFHGRSDNSTGFATPPGHRPATSHRPHSLIFNSLLE